MQPASLLRELIMLLWDNTMSNVQNSHVNSTSG